MLELRKTVKHARMGPKSIIHIVFCDMKSSSIGPISLNLLISKYKRSHIGKYSVENRAAGRCLENPA